MTAAANNVEIGLQVPASSRRGAPAGILTLGFAPDPRHDGDMAALLSVEGVVGGCAPSGSSSTAPCLTSTSSRFVGPRRALVHGQPHDCADRQALRPRPWSASATENSEGFEIFLMSTETKYRYQQEFTVVADRFWNLLDLTFF